MGLAISKKLVELMEGNIWAESTEGQGTNFNFTIHVQTSEGIAKVYLKSKEDKLKDKKVLIVDDNETNLRVLYHQTQNWGMSPTIVDSAQKALNMISDGYTFDVIITDMQMPDMDGYTLSQEIRKKHNKKNLPIIMLTSIGRNKDMDKAEILSSYLLKPVKQSQLFNVLVNVLFENNLIIKESSKINNKIPLIENKSLKILLAEDNPINQKLALRIFEKLGYRADAVSNGLEVLDILKTNPYDLIFMDIQMPEMDGLESTHHILEKYKTSDRPIIIAMTANAMKEDKERYLNSGMDDYISKPVSIDIIQDVINKWQNKILDKT